MRVCLNACWCVRACVCAHAPVYSSSLIKLPRPAPLRAFASSHPQSQFNATVEHGFQASAEWQQGRIVAAETGAAGPPMSTVQSCSWALRIKVRGRRPHGAGHDEKVGRWGNAQALPGIGGCCLEVHSHCTHTPTPRRQLTSSLSPLLAPGIMLSVLPRPQPLIGWGAEGGDQKPTAGWLSVLSVFEPHWQARLAGGRGGQAAEAPERWHVPLTCRWSL
jgi:hypothetical protein